MGYGILQLFLIGGVIHPDLLRRMDTAKVVEVWVLPVGWDAGWKHRPMSPVETVDLLRARARTDQRPVLQFLRRRKDVEEWRAFWIVDAVYVAGSPALIRDLAHLPEVKEILPVRRDAHILGERISSPVMLSTPTLPWGLDTLEVPRVWQDAHLSGEGVLVGILDTGLDPTHPALEGNFSGYFFDAAAGKPWAYDDHGHGTAVAGVIAGGDGPGPYPEDVGIAYRASIAACKAFGPGGLGSEVDILECLEWFASLRADSGVDVRVINNSWGMGKGNLRFWNAVWQNVRSLGMIPVVAAGNAGPNPASVLSPADYPTVIAVGATDSLDQVAWFSSRGPAPDTGVYQDTTWWSRPDWNFIKPDLSAPGMDILTLNPNGYFVWWSGTSLAAPHVTGTIALMLEKNSSLSYEEVYVLLTTAGLDVPPSGAPYPNNRLGWGRLNAWKAVNAVPGASGVYVRLLDPVLSDVEQMFGMGSPREVRFALWVPVLNLGDPLFEVRGRLDVLPPMDTGVRVLDGGAWYGDLGSGDAANGDGMRSPFLLPGFAPDPAFPVCFPSQAGKGLPFGKRCRFPWENRFIIPGWFMISRTPVPGKETGNSPTGTMRLRRSPSRLRRRGPMRPAPMRLPSTRILWTFRVWNMPG